MRCLRVNTQEIIIARTIPSQLCVHSIFGQECGYQRLSCSCSRYIGGLESRLRLWRALIMDGIAYAAGRFNSDEMGGGRPGGQSLRGSTGA